MVLVTRYKSTGRKDHIMMSKLFINGTQTSKNQYKIGQKTHSLLLAKICLKQGKKVFISFDGNVGEVLAIDQKLIHTKSARGGALIAIPK